MQQTSSITEYLAGLNIGDPVAVDNWRRIGWGSDYVPVMGRIVKRTPSGQLDVEFDGRTQRFAADGRLRGSSSGTKLIETTDHVLERIERFKITRRAEKAKKRVEEVRTDRHFKKLTNEQLTQMADLLDAAADIGEQGAK